MNKQIKIDKNMKIIFIVDFLVFIMNLIFRYVYINIGYYYNLINITFVLNIIFLIFCIAYTINLIIGKKTVKNFSIIVLSVFAIYILFNTVGVILINKPIEKKYKNIANKIISYCQNYSCDTYETKYLKDKRLLVIQKKYFDYDNKENNIVFETLYDKDKIIKTTAYVDSSSELYSEALIKKELDGYFKKYSKEINEQHILEAFEKRFVGSVSYDDIAYKVSEVYDKDNNLIKLKTIITLNINNWKNVFFLIYCIIGWLSIMILYITFEVIISLLVILIIKELIEILKDKKKKNSFLKNKKIITSNGKIKTEKYKEEDSINNVF